NRFQYDPHEILHAFHDSLSPKLDTVTHPFFGPSMLELRRQLGMVNDTDAINEAQSGLNQGMGIPGCRGAEETVGWSLYLSWLQSAGQGLKAVKALYANLISLNVATPGWPGAQLFHHGLIDTSPDPKAKQTLMSAGCDL